jgi:hypothetical protein
MQIVFILPILSTQVLMSPKEVTLLVTARSYLS